MESRKLQEKTRTKRNSKNKKKVKRKSALIDNVYYHTDDEEYVWKRHDCHRSTSFPLFSNQSDDEFIKSKTKERCYHHHKSKSAPADCALYDNVLINTEEPIQNDGSFPFVSLPVDCKLKIFSYLDHLQKSSLLSVCKSWYRILLHPSLWSRLSLWNFPMTCLTSQNSHEPTNSCYICYKKRVHLFANFLLWMNPRPKYLEFKFNIAEVSSGYLNMIENLVQNLNLRDLQVVCLNWKETPCRPYWIPPDDIEAKDTMYRHRLRARYFVSLFDLLTRKAPAIVTIVMPFDWSSRSVKCMSRLKNVHSLVLEKYYVFQCLSQNLLTELLDSLPNLRRFMLEVWTPSGPGLKLFSISSSTLEYFDVSQSRGFYIKQMNLPKLKRFRIMRHPWNGPLVDRIDIPCLYNILVTGAPKLCKLNDHYLKEEWKDSCYSILDEVLRSVCSCRKHKTGWAM
jgi:hypothetical protein